MQVKRLEAAKRGELEYFTGKPCKNGHIEKRDTVTGACKRCLKDHTINNRKSIKALILAAQTSTEG